MQDVTELTAEAAGTTLFRQGSCILARRPSPLFLFLQLKILSLECIQLYSVAGRDTDLQNFLREEM